MLPLGTIVINLIQHYPDRKFPIKFVVVVLSASRQNIMASRSRFTRLDAFTKTVDEARVRTTSGGIVTVVAVLIVLWLSLGEWLEYRRVIIHPELIVDKGRGAAISSHQVFLLFVSDGSKRY